MARKRMISPNVWQDPDFGRLSSDAKVMFFGLISNADDEGRLRGHPAYLKSIIFVYEDYSLKKVQVIRDEVACVMKNVVFYTVNTEEYIQFKNWDKYQKLRDDRIVDSSFPPPEKGTVTNTCQATDGQLTAEGKRREEKGREVKVREDSAVATPKQEASEFFEMFERNDSSLEKWFADFVANTQIPIDVAKREVTKFSNYWSERDSTGKKQRWQKQQTFEVKRRLVTWFSNASLWSKAKQPVGKKII